jgi:protein-S-isoprenylcysteine O-methyltransferase Ste14
MSTPTKKAMNGLLWSSAGMAVILFGTAGTPWFWQAWLYLFLFFGLSLFVTLDLAKNDPKLLERRSKGGPQAEGTTAQKIIMTLAMAGFVALLVVPGLDRRFGWSAVPVAVSLLALFVFVLSYLGIVAVFRANTFAASTVTVEHEQKVISTGPYAYVRHPMYAAGLVLLLATPVALGSWWGLAAFAPLGPVLIWRLLDEEAFLRKNLPGYSAYCARVTTRLLPFVW